jgi:hypothetical protein
MSAADMAPDDAYLARLSKTIEMVRLTHDMEINESIH